MHRLLNVDEINLLSYNKNKKQFFQLCCCCCCYRSPTTEHFREVTPRRRRSSPSSDNRQRSLVRPRSLVFASGESLVELPFAETRVAMKKYKSVVALREPSISPRHSGSDPTPPPRMYRSSRPGLTSNVSPSKVRDRIRQLTTTRNLDRGSRSLPRKATRIMEFRDSRDHLEDYEQDFQDTDSLTWSDSD